MFYIFNKENKCIGTCNSEPNHSDLESRGESALELTIKLEIGDTYKDGAVIKPVVIIDYEAKARNLRNSLRTKIDKLLLPAATFNDQLITDEQKQTLIADSLALATWPTTAGWPLVPLPELSPLLHSLITVPIWSYQ